MSILKERTEETSRKKKKIQEIQRLREQLSVKKRIAARQKYEDEFEERTRLGNGKTAKEDPSEWSRERLGAWLWSVQRSIIESIRDNRRTVVRSCHGSGKSFIAATAAAWWLACHPPGQAFVVTSAPSNYQTKAILWREIGRAHSRAKLPGRVNQSEWYLEDFNGHEELVAFGRKPADYEPDAFQGIHARYVLVILDEAAGIPDSLWEAAETLVTNEDSRILAIGNPTNPLGYFANVCKPGSGWKSFKISYKDTPNFTGEIRKALYEGKINQTQHDNLAASFISRLWVEEKRKDWGEDSPLWVARVEAEFPTADDSTLIPLNWVERAQKRDTSGNAAAKTKRKLGVDVARFGKDKTVGFIRHGETVKKCLFEIASSDTMEVVGKVIDTVRKKAVQEIYVDSIGVGAGVFDRLKEQGFDVHGVNVSSKPHDTEKFVNLRAELYWMMREDFENDHIEIPQYDDELANQLANIKFKYTSAGKVQIESKEEMQKRGLPSPDRADAVMLTYARPKRRAKIRISGVR